MSAKHLLLGVALFASGCATFRSAGRDVVGGALDELDRRGGAASITRSAAAGARDELTSAESTEKLKALQIAMMQQMTIDAAKMRQELLGEGFRADVEKARAEFLDKSRRDLGLMRDDLLGVRTEAGAGRVADRIVGDITRANLGLLRDEILGEKSRAMAEQLVHQTSSQMQREMDTMRTRLENDKHNLESDLRRTVWASSVLVSVLATTLLIVIFVVRRRARIIEALIEPMQELDDAATYAGLKRRIAKRADELGVGPLVRHWMGRSGPPDPPAPA